MIESADRKLAVVQSNYIPWKGYFDLIASADIFILYDDVQYTKNDWRNRNLIKTPQGKQWLTIPVKTSGQFGAAIKDIEVTSQAWRKKHWKTIEQNYRKAGYFERYYNLFKSLYLDSNETLLSQINFEFIRMICDILGISTQIRWSMEFDLPVDRVERIITLCEQTGSDHYISGPSARFYLDEEINRFKEFSIQISYFDYSGYLEYPQLYPPFDHYVSIVDLIFNTGHNAPSYMKMKLK